MVLRSASSPLNPEFDGLVQRQMEKWKVPGLTIAIVHGSSTWSKVRKEVQLMTTPLTLLSRLMEWPNSLIGR